MVKSSTPRARRFVASPRRKDPSDRSVAADVLLRREPDEDEEEDEGDGKEDDDKDDGYSE